MFFLAGLFYKSQSKPVTVEPESRLLNIVKQQRKKGKSQQVLLKSEEKKPQKDQKWIDVEEFLST